MPPPTAPFLGSSDALVAFLGELERAAASSATVLLLGESGTGKSAAARWLHEHGARADGPFVAQNVASLSPTLLEAALFGHERGAFTDAHRARTGLFERADGGTLLLDDVDCLPLEVQVKLLRVLQERVVEPLGAERSVPVDVRVVATSNRDLESLVDEGTFRADLFYRLAVLTLTVPPLRVRTADLGALAADLLRRVAARSRVAPRPLAPGALERLAAHPWPGNVRELENALERALVLTPQPVNGTPPPLEAAELAFLDEACRGAADEVAGEALRRGLTVDELTLAMMDRSLAEHRGNVSAAARQVGVTRRAFDYRMAHRDDRRGAPKASAESAETQDASAEERA